MKGLRLTLGTVVVLLCLVALNACSEKYKLHLGGTVRALKTIHQNNEDWEEYLRTNHVEGVRP